MSLQFCVRETLATNNPKIQGKSFKSVMLCGGHSNIPWASDVAVYQPQATKRPWDTEASALQKQERAHSSAVSGRDVMGIAWHREPGGPRTLASLCSTLSPPRTRCYWRGNLCPSFCLLVSFQCEFSCRQGADLPVLPLWKLSDAPGRGCYLLMQRPFFFLLLLYYIALAH